LGILIAFTPNHLQRVFFQTTMFHPEINPDSGELSLKKHFPK